MHFLKEYDFFQIKVNHGSWEVGNHVKLEHHNLPLILTLQKWKRPPMKISHLLAMIVLQRKIILSIMPTLYKWNQPTNLKWENNDKNLDFQYNIKKKGINFLFCPRKHEKMPSKVAHNRPHFFLFYPELPIWPKIENFISEIGHLLCDKNFLKKPYKFNFIYDTDFKKYTYIFFHF